MVVKVLGFLLLLGVGTRAQEYGPARQRLSHVIESELCTTPTDPGT